MLRRVLDTVLTAEQRMAGLYLEEDENLLFLKREGQVVVVFSATGATVASIREEAEKHLERG